MRNSPGNARFKSGDSLVQQHDLEVAVDAEETHATDASVRLAEIFDRYCEALDVGDQEAAERVLTEQAGVGEEYRVPLRGLYLLGRATKESVVNQHGSSKPPSQESDAVGQTPRRIGDFEIQHELGRGGMGIVYAANQISLQRQVALKVLPFAAVLDPRQVTRFRNEARSAASLHHPNIVPVYGVGCERGVHFYSMQLVHGQTLAQLVNQLSDHTTSQGDVFSHDAETAPCDNLNTARSIRSGSYVRSIMELGVKVAEAIHFAHEEGVVHRDIKPSNLLLDHAGKIWVADFGLARGRTSSNLTSAGSQLGTLRYMSPEQASGRHRAVDYRTDIYSLGITLCELVTLRPVFDSDDKLKLMAAIEAAEPQRLRLCNDTVPKELETVLNKAIAKLPADRYPSAQEFADDLRRCLSGDPIVAKPKSILDRCVDFVGRHRHAVSLAAVGLMMLMVASVAIASMFYQQRQRERRSAENARLFLQQAHKSVDRFGILLADELDRGAVAASMRARLLGEAAGYYDDFLAFSKHDSQFGFERAEALVQSAGIYERIGNDTVARARYQQAFEMLEELECKREDANAHYLRLACLNKIGMLHKRAGDFGAASSAYDRAVEYFKTWKMDSRHRTKGLLVIGQVHSNLALLRWAEGNKNAADTSFQNALRVLNLAIKEVTTVPQNTEETSELIRVRLRVGGNYVSMLGEVDSRRAEKLMRETVTMLENLPADKHGSSGASFRGDTRRQLADLRNNLAVMLSKNGKLVEASNLAEDVVQFWQLEQKRSEGAIDVVVVEHLATAWNTLGEVHWRSKKNKAAGTAFDRAEACLRKLVEVNGKRPEICSRLGGVLHNQSLVERRRRGSESTTGQMDQAIAFQSWAVETAPENVRYSRMLAMHREALAVLLKDSHEN